MYIRTINYENKPEFLASDKYVNFTCTVSDTGIKVVDGKKIVPMGSIIGPEGTVVNDNTAIGILFTDTDVTSGPREGALLVEGYILKDRLPVVITEASIGALKEIKFR